MKVPQRLVKIWQMVECKTEHSIFNSLHVYKKVLHKLNHTENDHIANKTPQMEVPDPRSKF